jgi:exonuclease VII small subunit
VTNFENLVFSERKITAHVIKHIAEIDRRRLFLEKGFTSVFDYLVKDIGYSPSAAMRRIDAARLMQELPEVVEKLETGSLTLSQATQVQKAARDFKKIKHANLNTETKRELFLQIENTSQKATEKIIAQTLDLPVPTHEKETLHRDHSVTLTLTFTAEQMEILEKAQDMIAHSGVSNDWAETVTYLAKKEVVRRTVTRTIKQDSTDTQITDTAAVVKVCTETPEMIQSKSIKNSKISNKRYIPQSIRKKLLHANAICSYKDHHGKYCKSQRFLQIDHIKNYCRGGGNTLDNLQVLCGVHNRLKYQLGQ